MSKGEPIMDQENEQPDAESPASQTEREWVEEILEAQSLCDKLEEARAAAEGAAKRAKKNHEAAVDALQSVIRRGPSQMKLDFKESTAAMSDADKHHAELMSRSIDEAIDLTDKQEEKLESAGVVTVGDFERLRAGQHPDYPGGLSDLPRVGQATIDKWEEEILAWLKENEFTSQTDENLSDRVADEFAAAGLLA